MCMLILIVSSVGLYAQSSRDSLTYYFVPQAPERTDVVSSVDVEAKYPGGPAGLMKFFGQHLKYPEICVELGKQSRLTLRLIIEKDGTVSLIQIRLRKDFDCFAEMESQIDGWLNAMPKWEPAFLNGESTACFYNFPIHIKFK